MKTPSTKNRKSTIWAIPVTLIALFSTTLSNPALTTPQAFASHALGQPFDDVAATHKYADSIWFLKDNGVVQGYEDGTYHADSPLTRAEFMKIIILGTGLQVPTATTAPFSDTPLDEWYTNFIAYGSAQGYIEGYSDGTFRPNQAINKVEALKVLGELVMWNFSNNPTPLTTFTDINFSDWYGKYLAYAINHNIIDDTGTLYSPATPITRGQMAEYIFRDYTVRELDLERYETTFGDQVLNGDNYSITQNSTPAPALSSCTTPQEALDALQNVVISSEPQKDYLRAYQFPNLLHQSDTFDYFTNNETTSTQEKVAEDQWFYWLDLHPTEKFSHETKIVTVTTDDCTVNQYDSDLWPAVNNQVLWTTDTERSTTQNLVYLGDKADPPAAAAPALPDPVFAACNADPAAKKKAIILYLGEDRLFKLDAVNMHKHLCSKNYQTTVITGDDNVQVYQEIVTTIQNIATASKEPNGSLNSFFFYITSHGFRNNGDLMVNVEDTVNAAGEHRLIAKIISLPLLTNTIGSEAFSEMRSEVFNFEHDTCYSGNATALYQAEANAVDSVIGWIGNSSDSASPSKGSDLTGSVHTNSIIRCTADISPYANFQACMNGEMLTGLKGTIANSSSISKLSNKTGDAVPFIP